MWKIGQQACTERILKNTYAAEHHQSLFLGNLAGFDFVDQDQVCIRFLTQNDCAYLPKAEAPPEPLLRNREICCALNLRSSSIQRFRPIQ